MAELIVVAALALAAGALLGWLFAGRKAGALAGDLAVAQTRAADADIHRKARDEVERERNAAHQELTALRERSSAQAASLADVSARLAKVSLEGQESERERHEALAQIARLEAEATAFDARLTEFRAAKDEMAGQFREVAGKLLGEAQSNFLKRAEERFGQQGEANEVKMKSLLQPVETTLKRYEESLGRIEKEREGSYRELSHAVQQLTTNNAAVIKETQRLANVMRSSPKARGRWGEEQLRTILEAAGLAENVDFSLQETVTDGERQLRPDCVVNLPGNRCIVIDVKCPLVAFEQAFDEEDEGRRADFLLQHANALRTYASDLGRKGYWRQFDRSPDFVIMFVPGEHFLSAAAERAPDLIEAAFRNGVVVASTINMLALAKIMAGMWQQEGLREQAKEIAEVGKELYRRLSKMSEHVAKFGRNLSLANDGYNAFIGSLESQVYTQARRFEALNVDTGGKQIETPPRIEQPVRALTKLSVAE